MNEEFRRRLVEVKSDKDIDCLESRAVVFVKNDCPRVFDRREGDMVIFYYPDFFDKDKVEERSVPRSYLGVTGNMIHFNFTSFERVRLLSDKDGGYYQERRDDLVKLGLMK